MKLSKKNKFRDRNFDDIFMIYEIFATCPEN